MGCAPASGSTRHQGLGGTRKQCAGCRHRAVATGRRAQRRGRTAQPGSTQRRGAPSVRGPRRLQANRTPRQRSAGSERRTARATARDGCSRDRQDPVRPMAPAAATVRWGVGWDKQSEALVGRRSLDCSWCPRQGAIQLVFGLRRPTKMLRDLVPPYAINPRHGDTPRTVRAG